MQTTLLKLVFGQGSRDRVISVANVTIVNANFADNKISKMIMILKAIYKDKVWYLALFWT